MREKRKKCAFAFVCIPWGRDLNPTEIQIHIACFDGKESNENTDKHVKEENLYKLESQASYLYG